MNKKLIPVALIAGLISAQVSATTEVKETKQVTTKVKFPDVKKSYLKQAPRFDASELSHVTKNLGVDRDTMRARIGNPHFSEFMTSTWNYFFDVKVPGQEGYMRCQLRVKFDKNDKTVGKWWKPSSCDQAVNNPVVDNSKVVVLNQNTTEQPQPVKLERFHLEADGLFEFDSAELSNMPTEKNSELDDIVKQLLILQESVDLKIDISGHTDYLGNDIYNFVLSNKRAQSVRNYFIEKGIKQNSIAISGLGEIQPIKNCDSSLSRSKLINCLQPNRRVTIEISGIF